MIHPIIICGEEKMTFFYGQQHIMTWWDDNCGWFTFYGAYNTGLRWATQYLKGPF